MSLSVFDEVGHIEIDIAEVNDIILFCVLHVVEIKHEFVNTVAIKHDIEGIVDEISANHDLKNAVETVVELFHVELPINLVEMPVIHVKLLFKFKSDAVRGKSMKKFR